MEGNVYMIKRDKRAKYVRMAKITGVVLMSLLMSGGTACGDEKPVVQENNGIADAENSELTKPPETMPEGTAEVMVEATPEITPEIADNTKNEESTEQEENLEGAYVYYDSVVVTKLDDMRYLSPDGELAVEFYKDAKGGYYYSVAAGETELIKISALGIQLDGYDLGSGLTIDTQKIATHTIEESFDLFTGAKAEHTNHCNETILPFKGKDGTFDLVLRVYDEGMALRYRDVTVADADVTEVKVKKELTQVGLTDNAVTWAFGINGTYEGDYEKRTRIQVQVARMTLSAPVYVEEDGYYMLLTEAAVYNNNGEYCSSGLNTGKLLTWTPGLARDPQHEVTGDVDSPGHIDLVEFTTCNGFSTPWRVAVIAADLNTFMTTDMIAALNADPDASLFADTSWIKPGAVAWSWWAEGDVQGSYDKHVEYVDFAAENGWEYVCLDAGWRAFENRIDRLCNYAAQKNVGIYVWVNYRDLKETEQLEYLFSKWAEAGVAGIKTDYFESDEPDVLLCMQNIAEVAAKNHLMLLYHGCIRPGGENRTYPNVLTMEAVMGEEFHKWSTSPSVKNCLVYPFTRNLVGPMDYTPLCQPSGNDETAAFALAKAVVYESGLVHYADAAANYKKFAGLSLINRIDGTWENTLILDGKIGEHISMMRQTEGDYFIGGMTLNARTVQYSMDFLEDGQYNAYIYEDNEDKTALRVSSREVTKDSVLTFDLSERGGIVVMLTKDVIDISVAEEEEILMSSYTFYEAEAANNQLGGAAVVANAALCSGRKKAGYIGNGDANSLTFTGITVPETGSYEVILYYCTGENRNVTVAVNGETIDTFRAVSTGSYGVAGLLAMTLELVQGENTITFGNASGYAPDIDRIAIEK